MAEIKRHDNRLGIWGWLGGGRWGVERYAYILHRLTGLGILLYFLMHIVVTSLRAFGIYAMEVADPQLFVNKIVGTRGYYETSQIEGYLRMHHHEGIVRKGRIRSRNL